MGNISLTNRSKSKKRVKDRLTAVLANVQTWNVSGRTILESGLRKLDIALNSDDLATSMGALDKLIKLLPFVIEREAAPLNIPSMDGSGTPVILQQFNQYILDRDSQVKGGEIAKPAPEPTDCQIVKEDPPA